MFDMKRIMRAQLAVSALVAFGIGLFLFIYFVLYGDTTPIVQRLFTALLVPPFAIGLIVGGYFLWTRGNNTEQK
jgi:hypothetical protein